MSSATPTVYMTREQIPTCEVHKINWQARYQLAYANITVSGDKASIPMAVCETHLRQLVEAVNSQQEG